MKLAQRQHFLVIAFSTVFLPPPVKSWACKPNYGNTCAAKYATIWSGQEKWGKLWGNCEETKGKSQANIFSPALCVCVQKTTWHKKLQCITLGIFLQLYGRRGRYTSVACLFAPRNNGLHMWRLKLCPSMMLPLFVCVCGGGGVRVSPFARQNATISFT